MDVGNSFCCLFSNWESLTAVLNGKGSGIALSKSFKEGQLILISYVPKRPRRHLANTDFLIGRRGNNGT